MKMQQQQSLEDRTDNNQIASPLLFTIDSGTQDFTHDTTGEFFLARDFAARINSGELSIREAYINDWSYIEDKELWGLEDLEDDECRAVLPAWRNTLEFLGEFLDDKSREELISLTSNSYFSTKERLKDRRYNPFFRELFFTSKIMRKRENSSKLDDKITEEFNEKLYSLPIAVQKQAATCLGNIRSKKAIGYLEGYISKDSPVEVAEHICKILGDCGAEDELIRIIDNPETSSPTAIFSLGKIGRKRAEEVLTDILLDSRTKDNFRFYAIEALGRRNTNTAADFLVKYLFQTEREKNYIAACALAETGTETATKAFLDYLSNPKTPRKKYVETELCKIIENFSIKVEETIDRLMTIFNDSENPDRYLAADLLNEIYTYKKTEYRRSEVIASGLRYISDPDAPKKEEVMKLLGKLKADDAVDTLIGILFDPIEIRKRRLRCETPQAELEEESRVIETLGKIGGEKAAKALADYLSDKSNPKRNHTASVLSWMQEDIIIEPLIEFIADPAIKQKYHTYPIAKKGGKKLVDALVRCINDPDIAERQTFLVILSDLKSEEIPVDELIKYISNPQNAERYLAAIALGKTGKKEAEEAILTYIENITGIERYNACRSLSKIKDPRAVQILDSALYDRQCKYKTGKIETLTEIGSDDAVDTLYRYVLDSKLPELSETEYREEVRRSKSEAFEAICKIESKKALEALTLLRDKGHHTWKSLVMIGDKKSLKILIEESERSYNYYANESMYSTIIDLHEKLRPQSYNPKVKRLTA